MCFGKCEKVQNHFFSCLECDESFCSYDHAWYHNRVVHGKKLPKELDNPIDEVLINKLLS